MTENYAQQIYTKKGLVKDNIFEGKNVLHFGSGSKKLQGSTTVDILNLPNVDVVHDLNVYPWPFEDNSQDFIFGHNVFEHLKDIVSVMNEVHRILKPGGRVLITVPYFRSVDAFSDLTHKQFFTSQSMEHFIESGSTASNYQYTKNKFKKIGFWYGWPQPSSNPAVQMFKTFIHKHPKIYDSHISLLFPVKIIIWELEVVK